MMMFDYKEIAQKALVRAEEIKTKRRRERRFLVIGMSAAVLAVALIFVSMTYPTTPDPTIQELENTPIPMAQSPPSVSEFELTVSSFLPGYDNIQIPSGAKEAYLPLVNPEGSGYPISFEIILTESNESLFISPTLPPSMSIDKVTLSRPLEKGTYQALLAVTFYESADNQTNPPPPENALFRFTVSVY